MSDERDQSRDALLRLSVPQAASRLGVTQSAIRKRVQRRQIPFDKDEHGHTYVYLSHDELRHRDSHNGPVTEDAVTGQDELRARIESLEQQVSFLQEELKARRDEAMRKDVHLANVTAAMRALTGATDTSPDEREAPVSASEDSGSTSSSPPPAPEESRSWLRRFFGV
jgi:hypothetical protein